MWAEVHIGMCLFPVNYSLLIWVQASNKFISLWRNGQSTFTRRPFWRTSGPILALDLGSNLVAVFAFSLQDLAQELEEQDEKRKLLNRIELEVLSDKSLSLHERENISESLRSVNMTWSKVGTQSSLCVLLLTKNSIMHLSNT